MKQMIQGFRRLTQYDRNLFDKYYNEMNGYWPSSLCFTEMNGWKHSLTVYYKEVHDFMVCAAWNHDTSRLVFLPFLGHYTQDKVNATFAEVDKWMSEMQLPLVIMDVGEWMKEYYEAIPGVSFEVIYDRGLSDYMYKVEDFKNALQNEKIRYNYNYFVRRNQPLTVPIKPEHLQECLNLIDNNWCTTHNCEECVYGCLKKTMENTIPYMEELDANGILVYVADELVAYCIVSCRRGMGSFHFKKTQRGFQGINEFLHRECLERFLQDAEVINYAEDMNLDGLRVYKSRLSEHFLAPRYELRKTYREE